MKYTPHPFQQVGIDHALQFLNSAKPGDRVSYASPTGTGKSVVELFVQLGGPEGTWIVTPREEIVVGMMDKLGGDADPLAHRITTPIRLRNLLLRGDVPPPK